MENLWITATPPTVTVPQPSAGVDFWDLLDSAGEWQQLSGSLTTLKLYQSTVYKLPDADLRRLFKWLNDNHIDLALEAGVLPVPVWPGPGAGVEGFNPSIIPLLQKIKSLGGNLKYFTLDEPYYHATQWTGQNQALYSIDFTANMLAGVLKNAWKLFPDLKVIDIEPVPYTKNIAQWLDAYQLATGRPLDGFQADVVWVADWESSVISMLEALDARGIQPSFIINGNASDATDMAWTDSAILNYISLMSVPGSTDAPMVFQTWQPTNPSLLFPEYKAGTLANTALATTYFDSVVTVFHNSGISNPSMFEVFSALRQLSCGDVDMAQLQKNIQAYGTSTPFTKIYYGPGTLNANIEYKNNDTIILRSSDATVFTGSSRVILESDIKFAGANVIGNRLGQTDLNVIGGGNLSIGRYTSNVTVNVSQAVTFRFHNTNDNVTIKAATVAGSQFWLSSSGQSIIASVGYSCVYASGWMLNGPGIIAGSGATQINLYEGGTFSLGSNVTGIGTFILYRTSSQGSYNINATSQKNAVFNDQFGGNTLAINDRSNTIVNKGALVTTARVGEFGASATFIGSGAKIAVEVSDSSSFVVNKNTSNAIFYVNSNSDIELNNSSSVSVVSKGDNNNIRVTRSDQNVEIFGKQNTVFADNRLLTGGGALKLKGDGTTDLVLTGTGNCALPSNLIGIRNIFVGSKSLSDVTPTFAMAATVNMANWRPANQAATTIAINSATPLININANNNVSLFLDFSTSKTNIIGNGMTSTVLYLSGGGNQQLGALTRNLSVIFDKPTNFRLSDNRSINVIANNNGGNSFWLYSGGQSIVATVGYSCIYASGWMLDGASFITGSGTTQLNLYDGGSVKLGNQISGVGQLMLYRSTNQPAYDVEVDGQNAMNINDKSGGNNISIKSSVVTIRNNGIFETNVNLGQFSQGSAFVGASARVNVKVESGLTHIASNITQNTNFSISNNTAITLNANSTVSVTSNGYGNVIALGNVMQTVRVLGLSTSVLVTTEMMSSATKLRITGSGTTGLVVTTPGAFTLPSYITGVSEIALQTSKQSGASASLGSWGVGRWNGTQQFDYRITLNAGAPALKVLGDGNAAMFATQLNQKTTVLGNGITSSTIFVSEGGNQQIGQMSTGVSVVFEKSTSFRMSLQSNFAVIADKSGGNAFWMGAAGQTVLASVGYSIIYASGWMIDGGSRITGSGATQLNLYDGGFVRFDSRITGLSSVVLYKSMGQANYQIDLLGQKNMTVVDQSGGNIILAYDRSISILNKGVADTVVRVNLENAGGNWIGAQAKVVVDVAGSGDIQVSRSTNNAVFKISGNTNIFTNKMEFITVDASVGNSTISLNGNGQKAILGNNTTVRIDENVKGNLEASMDKAIHMDIYGFNKDDMIKLFGSDLSHINTNFVRYNWGTELKLEGSNYSNNIKFFGSNIVSNIFVEKSNSQELSIYYK